MTGAASVAEQFSIDLLQQGGELHDFAVADLLDSELTARGLHFLERPCFLDEAELVRYSRDLDTCTELLASLADRLCAGSWAALAEVLGLPAPAIELIRAAEGLPRPRFGRVDALLSDHGIQVVEFNATSETGGLDWIDLMARAWLDQPAVLRFLADRHCEYVSPLAVLAAELRAFSAGYGGPAEPTVAIVEGTGGLALYGSTWHLMREVLAAAGFPTVLCELPEISVRNGRAYAAGMAVDVIYRGFELAQVTADPASTALLLELIRLAHAGGVGIWTSIDSELLRNKGCMALLHSAELAAPELAAVQRLLPETRLLSTPPTDTELAELLRGQRELILKPTDAYRGIGVIAGWEVTPQRWESEIRALNRRTIVQHRVRPVAEPVRDRNGTTRSVETRYGFYYTPGHAYAGGAGSTRPYGSHYITDKGNGPRAEAAPVVITK